MNDKMARAYELWDEARAGGNHEHDALRLVIEAIAPKPEAQAAGGAAPSIAAAEAMGAIGGPTAEPERLAFEAWMRGHCWALRATWDGSAYISDAEQGGGYCPDAARTRMQWAAWRDRAALSTPASHDAQQPNVEVKAKAMFEAQADKMAAPWERQWEPTKEHWRAKARDALAQQPAVVGDGVRPFAWYRPRGDQEPEFRTSPPPDGHGWLPVPGFTTNDKLVAALTPAATPRDKHGRDAAQVMRDALAYVKVRTDGDLLALADRAENWIRESRVLIDMQAKLIAAQKEGNGNG